MVFAVCVLHHVVPGRRVDFALELARVVRPGGLVVVFEHNALNPFTRLAVSRCQFDEGVVLLTRGASTRVLIGAGLAPIEARDVIFTPFDHRLARRLDQAIGRVPLGAQHYVAARRDAVDGDQPCHHVAWSQRTTVSHITVDRDQSRRQPRVR